MDVLERSKVRNSQLCIGLDPRVPREERMTKMLEIIDQTYDLTPVYKLNRQFWLDTPNQDLIEINKRIKKYNNLSIIDHKLSDIGSSNEYALKISSDQGFDYITVSPFPGNLKATSEMAKKYDIGIISLVLMSNPEAEWMKTSGLYEKWAVISEEYANGIVVGTTNHVTKEVIEKLSTLISKPFILAPGLGSQGGKLDTLLSYFPETTLFNVSRGISQSENYRDSALDYLEKIKNMKAKL